MDPVRASYNVEDYSAAISNLAQTTMRSEIGKMSLVFRIIGLMPYCAIFFRKASCGALPPTARTHPESAHKSQTVSGVRDACRTKLLNVCKHKFNQYI